MANRYAVANGNWSNTSTWNGGTLPASDDVVRPNGFTVVIDQDVTVSELRNDASSPAVAAGVFEIYGNYTINCTTITTNFNYSNNAGLIRNYNPGTTTINSNITGNRSAIYNDTIGTLIIVGDLSYSSTGNVFITNLNGNLTILGNFTFTGANTGGSIITNTGNVNITGNVTGGQTSNSNVTIRNNGVGAVNITGLVTGGATSTSNFAITNTSTGTINITGTTSANIAAAINSTTAGIINVIGQLQATPSANAVSSTSTTATNVFSGPLINSGSTNAIYCYNIELYDDVTTRYEIGVSGSNDTITLYSPDQVTGVPSGSDVRVGTIYGPGNELTGSMYVPHPNSVSIGVAVDNTTGSAIVKPEDLWNYALTSLTSSNSIGQRLASTATSASNAAIVSSFSN